MSDENIVYKKEETCKTRELIEKFAPPRWQIEFLYRLGRYERLRDFYILDYPTMKNMDALLMDVCLWIEDCAVDQSVVGTLNVEEMLAGKYDDIAYVPWGDRWSGVE